MVKYHKIDTVFERDTTGTKKLIEGKFRDAFVEFLADNEWEFTEKIDGTNIRIHWDGHKIEFGGRTERAQIPAPLVNKLTELFMNEESEQLFEQMFGEKEVILFGEGYGSKIQAVGDQYSKDVNFILFDVLIGENFQPREVVDKIATSFGVDSVPIVLRGTIHDAVSFVKSKPQSTIGTAPMEGVVGRPKVELRDRCGSRIIVKIKVNDFVMA